MIQSSWKIIVIDIGKKKVDTSGKCKTLKNSVPCVSLVL